MARSLSFKVSVAALLCAVVLLAFSEQVFGIGDCPKSFKDYKTQCKAGTLKTCAPKDGSKAVVKSAGHKSKMLVLTDDEGNEYWMSKKDVKMETQAAMSEDDAALSPNHDTFVMKTLKGVSLGACAMLVCAVVAVVILRRDSPDLL